MRKVYLDLRVVVEYLSDVEVEPHELCQGLLAHDSLGLQVALLDSLGWQDARAILKYHNLLLNIDLLFNLLPSADAKLHQCQAES
jgi:hypothetical protein